MREQLQFILNLREDIKNMNTKKEKLKTEYDNLNTEFVTISDSIEVMKKDSKDVNNEYKNTIFNNSFKITKYFGWSVGIVLFVGSLISEGFTVPLLLGIFGCVSSLTGVMSSYALSTILCSTNKFVSYMIKNDSNVKKLYDRINQLDKDICLNEKNIIDIKRKLLVAESNYTSKENELNIKINELLKLEDAFFNRLIGANIGSYNLDENIECKTCKRRLLTPNDGVKK